MVTKIEKRDGFRKQETDYRWNGKNELIGITTPKGEVWHYKYDALGRRIAKECPQQHLRIEYLWDGDQLAFTRTFKNYELISERHSVFNGFELIAQQDRYQQLKQTIDGNIVEWKNQTHYAVVQPNGNVLGLLTPEGKLGWKPQNKSLWGLAFNTYNFNSNLDPNLLFAGQYYDEESGLAYNRFRYYDPESGNYISSDPIGLLGGNNPYLYTLNPNDWIDPFGLAGNPATATHIVYRGFDVKTGKPYIGYASMQGNQMSNAQKVLNYRYNSNFERFGGKTPRILYRGYGQEGKDIARGLEQRHFEQAGGLGHTANKQNPVGLNNKRRDIYLDAADKHLKNNGRICGRK